MSVIQHLKPLALALTLFGAAPAVAQPVTLDVAGMRQLAVLTISSGRAAQALDMADALLQRDPKDRVGLIVRARALRDLGRAAEAVAPARDAWDVSTTKAEQFTAAMTLAQALASDGRRTRAQFWLRRAAQVAPNDKAKAAAVQGFGYVKSRNPLSLSFSGSISPSSNINGGSTETSFGSFTLTGASLALSGMEASLGFGARYRVSSTQTSQTELSFSAQGQAYSLSSKAKALAPLARGSDYAFGVLEAGVSHRGQAGRAVLSFGATLGHNWYGGQDLSEYLRLETGVQWLLNPRTQANLGLTLERQNRLDGPGQNATVAGLSGTVTHVLGNQDTVRFATSLRQSRSATNFLDYQNIGLRVDYYRAAPVAGISLSGGLSFDARRYDAYPFSATGRQDNKLGVSLTAVFNRFDYYGFVPSLDLTASKTNSNLTRFESREFGIGFGVKSAF